MQGKGKVTTTATYPKLVLSVEVWVPRSVTCHVVSVYSTESILDKAGPCK